jgi:hypothetical protein
MRGSIRGNIFFQKENRVFTQTVNNILAKPDGWELGRLLKAVTNFDTGSKTYRRPRVARWSGPC